MSVFFADCFYLYRPCHTLPDSTNGRVTDSKILSPFVSVGMPFLSVSHAVNAFRVRCCPFSRSYPLASFGHVQNFERTPPDKDVRWVNITRALVCGLSCDRAFGIL